MIGALYATGRKVAMDGAWRYTTLLVERAERIYPLVGILFYYVDAAIMQFMRVFLY